MDTSPHQQRFPNLPYYSKKKGEQQKKNSPAEDVLPHSTVREYTPSSKTERKKYGPVVEPWHHQVYHAPHEIHDYVYDKDLPPPQPSNLPPQDTHADLQTLFKWTAPLRPYKKNSGKVLRFFVALAVLLSLIMVFFGDNILLIPIWALLFLFYVLTITPPPDIENKITQFGIETAGITLRWEVLSHFYYTERFGYYILTMVTHGPYYLHSYVVVPNEEIKGIVTQILSQHIMFQAKPKRTLTDRIIHVLSHLIPDDEDNDQHTHGAKNYTPLQNTEKNQKEKPSPRPLFSFPKFSIPFFSKK